ncbi:hypothetical protein D3C84_1056270 [compost metagenome]
MPVLLHQPYLLLYMCQIIRKPLSPFQFACDRKHIDTVADQATAAHIRLSCTWRTDDNLPLAGKLMQKCFECGQHRYE